MDSAIAKIGRSMKKCDNFIRKGVRGVQGVAGVQDLLTGRSDAVHLPELFQPDAFLNSLNFLYSSNSFFCSYWCLPLLSDRFIVDALSRFLLFPDFTLSPEAPEATSSEPALTWTSIANSSVAYFVISVGSAFTFMFGRTLPIPSTITVSSPERPFVITRRPSSIGPVSTV